MIPEPMAKHIRKILIAHAIGASTILHANIIPENQCAIIVGSTADPADAGKLVSKYSSVAKKMAVIKSNNGYYAASLGIFDRKEGIDLLAKLKAEAKIPSDAICANHSRFVEVMYLDNATTKASDSALSANAHKTDKKTELNRNAEISKSNDEKKITEENKIRQKEADTKTAQIKRSVNSAPKVQYIADRKSKGESIPIGEEALFFIVGGHHQGGSERIAVTKCTTIVDLHMHDIMPELKLDSDYYKEIATLRIITDYSKINWKSESYNQYANGAEELVLQCAEPCRRFEHYQDNNSEYAETYSKGLKTLAVFMGNNTLKSDITGLKQRYIRAIEVAKKSCPGITSKF